MNALDQAVEKSLRNRTSRWLTPHERRYIYNYIKNNPGEKHSSISERFRIAPSTVSFIKKDQSFRIEELEAQLKREVYEHPAYKEQKEKLRWCEKQIFNDRNKINQLCARIHDLELRIMSLNRQLEDPSQP